MLSYRKMEDFPKLLTNFEKRFSDIIHKKIPLKLNLSDLKRLNSVKQLIENVNFLPEIYEWNKISRSKQFFKI